MQKISTANSAVPGKTVEQVGGWSSRDSFPRGKNEHWYKHHQKNRSLLVRVKDVVSEVFFLLVQFIPIILSTEMGYDMKVLRERK